MKSSLRIVGAAFIATTGIFAAAGAASAMPAAPAQEPGASSMLQDVRWGCGPGWHPNPWGRCVPNWRGGGAYYGGGWGGGWHRGGYWHGGGRRWHGGGGHWNGGGGHWNGGGGHWNGGGGHHIYRH